MRVAIVGGGPSGLMTAHLLEQKLPEARITIYEASDRIGGKLQTRRFGAAPDIHEAGVAECYDYSAFGPDPLKRLVTGLGLIPIPTHGSAVAIDGRIARTAGDIERAFGPAAARAVDEFQSRAAAMLPPARWARGFVPADNDHPWATRTAADILDEIGDPLARTYLHVATHSDLATEPHLVNGLVGLRNFLKADARYGAQYSIAGGMEQLARRLAASLVRTRFELGARIQSLARREDGDYRMAARIASDRRADADADVVVLALPHLDLLSIDTPEANLRRALTTHAGHYGPPGHYLRISVLFDRPFWGGAFTGSWIMLDAFGGCCVYDETERLGGSHGVLGWLIAGTPALAMCNAGDEALVTQAMASLPGGLAAAARASFIEARVYRWAGGVSGQPGGFSIRDPRTAHQPAAATHPDVFVVGDYLFDSTLNGVLRSADIVTDMIARRRAAAPERRAPPPQPRRTGHPGAYAARYTPQTVDGGMSP